MERITLTGIPGSHPVAAVQAMLERKELPYVRRDFPNQLHRRLLRLRGFHGRTVPTARIGARRVEGSLAIARALDEVKALPPLFPLDAGRRAVVEELERWADDELQQNARRLAYWAVQHDRSSLATFATPSYLPFPPWLTKLLVPVLAPVILHGMRVGDAEARDRLATLTGQLDRIDAAIEQDIIGGPEPNAADYQVAGSVGLLLCFDDLRSRIEWRPAGMLSRRLVPVYPGRFVSVFPAEWLRPLD
ncbi:MAG TPA: glutathione S-transferase N-terminal domain-containing protein [Gaiellaceae bacterium]|nr:glutathione S-transferase N-terminal domain-containing protein [Gaiellaceae bacterium]